MNRVIVLGGNGFVGSAFVRFFEEKKIPVISVTRENYNTFRRETSDVVINAAGNSKKYLADADPVKEFDETVSKCLRSLIDFPCKIWVQISSVDVYDNLSSFDTTLEDREVNASGISHYGFHKLLTEQVVRHYSKEWLIVRFAGMVGPGLKKNPVYDILHGLPLRIHPESQYQFLATDECAQATWKIISDQYRNTVFNICGNGLISPREIAEIAGLSPDLTMIMQNDAPRIVKINNERINTVLPVSQSRDVIEQFIRHSS